MVYNFEENRWIKEITSA